MEIQIKFTLKLNIDEWGMYKKGDTEEFFINVFDEQNGLVRFPIDKRWDIVSKEIVRVENANTGEKQCNLPVVSKRFLVKHWCPIRNRDDETEIEDVDEANARLQFQKWGTGEVIKEVVEL